ncbi:MFS transporter [Streptomyces triticiradicis]|uniref:MFS transporter n=1 Tax=Streptomyces triticiradicis TaxID=2651189 RepID=A0A7J5D9E4_9ACTN|nr:MFS transporter [Streptomyces triticiradicis]KAB1984556.1 MFS transporter [Streptomyces triticiradicis]
MSASPSRPSYAALFRMPHARRTFAAAMTGRLSYGVVSLAMMLTTTRATGSYAVAGTVMALFGATSVFLSPARAALIDRYGPRRALIPMASLYAGLLTAFAVTAWRPGAPVAAVGALAVAAGACTPPLGPTLRAVWGEVVQDERLLQRAYSLDGVVEEILFVSGPLVVGAVVRTAPPAAAVVLSALLVWSGTLAFVLSPLVAGVRPPAARGASGTARGGRRERGGRALARPVVAAAGVGLSLGAVDLLVMAFAERHHHGAGVVAWVLAALSLGSALGGLLNGAVDWRAAPGVRLPLLAGALGLALLGAGLAQSLGALAVAVACAGFFVAPALTTSYLMADAAAPPGFRTRAGAWVNTAVNAGGSMGTAGAGLLVGRLPLGLCFAVSGAVAMAAALVCARNARTPRPDADAGFEVTDRERLLG